MASAVPHEEEAAQSSPEMKEEEQEVVKEVANLSLVSSACEVVSADCDSSKESQPCLSSVCDAAEKGVQSVTQATASCVQPTLANLEPHVYAVSEYAAKGLEKLGEELPLVPKLMLPGTKELLSSTVAEVKESVSSGVLEALDVTRDTLQGSEGTATPAVTSVEPAVPQRGVLGAEAVLGTAEGDSLPTGNEELAQLAVSEEGMAALPLKQQQQHLDSLPEDLRLLAQLHSPARIQHFAVPQLSCLSWLSALPVPQIEALKQFNRKLQEEKAELHQMWLDWTRKYLKESGDESPSEPEEMECGTLLMASRISQQMQLSCSELVAAMQDLPCSLPDALQQAWCAIEELRAAFLGASSFQDLSGSVLAQSQRELAVVQEYIEELLDYLKNNTPLSGLVGPSSPREEEEDQSSKEEEEKAPDQWESHIRSVKLHKNELCT
uniref:Perilipin n=1 Tax=Junco hyemalis TaxID=40217 RepID=A0A8C5IR24_JUNHY